MRFKKIHHEQANGDNSCNKLCCTKIENFSVSRGGNKILQNVNIHMHCGELTAIVGANGAGKSTLLKAMLGEISHSGKLRYFDQKGLHSGKPVVGYVPQHLNFDHNMPTSVLDFFAAVLSPLPCWLWRTNSLREQVKKSLALVAAEHLLERRLGELSGGELQRVLLALALDPIPDLLLLDEPISGIDHNGLALFYQMVSSLRANYDLAIILVSHDLDLIAQYADRVVVLAGRVVANGSPEQVFRDKNVQDIFGTGIVNFLAPKANEAVQ